MDYTKAKNILISGDYSIANWFKENNYDLEYAYCLFLCGDLEGSKNILEKIKYYNLRADWAWKLACLIEGKICYPTFLQVRNFLEVDLTLLMNAKNYGYVDRLLEFAPLFFDICRESYKFIGRALYYNSFEDMAIKYYKIAKENFYNDGELHYLFGIYYYETNQKEECIKSLRTCLELIGEYKPAEKMLKTIIDK